MTETNNYLVPECSYLIGERVQIGVVLPSGYLGERNIGWVYLHDRCSAVTSGSTSKRQLEDFVPSAVIGDEIRLPADGLRELLYAGIRAWRAWFVNAEITYLLRLDRRG
jgi:hypothetical protein